MTKKQELAVKRILNYEKQIRKEQSDRTLEDIWNKTFDRISPTGVIDKTFQYNSPKPKRKKFTF